MRDFNQPKEFEEDSDINTKELYCANGLRITYSDFLNKTYLLKTDLYLVIVSERYFGRSNRVWALSIIESENKFFTNSCDELPEFMQTFHGDAVRNFTSAEEVDSLIKKLLGLKAFL